MNVLVIGRTEILYNTVLVLSSTHQICGIITAPASPEYLRSESDFEKLARELNCPFLLTKSVKKQETIEFVNNIKPDIAISINWVSIIGQEFIELFPYGIINAHFGDLPRYRGNAVTNWAMILGESSIKITLHFMEAGELDSGDILSQKEFPILDSTTIADINHFAQEKVPELFLDVLDKIERKVLTPVSQSQTGKLPFRCFPRLPNDSRINWQESAKNIDLLIRASTHPYNGAYTYLILQGDLKKLYIWKCRIVADRTADIGTPGHIIKNDKKTGESWVYTGQGIIAIKEASFDGEDIFEPGKVWRSIRMRFECDVEDEIIKLYHEVNQLKKILLRKLQNNDKC